MKQRRDGMETRQRLLDAACRVFAEKGYKAARVADICRRARANVAAVNYHFGNKAALYVEAWKYAFSLGKPTAADIPAHLDPEERLRAFVRRFLRHVVEPDASHLFMRLYFMELIHPTGLVNEIWQQLIEPHRRVLLRILADLLGKDPSDPQVLFCELSVVGQCRAACMLRHRDLEYLLDAPVTDDLVDRLTDHITRFSLAGIHATMTNGKS
ncbi:transcriptional regulator, TetR family [Desulfacinum infernum DSM 9756]|uniref:Transcriptional regulator, TetR family n=1 Tax=Desulfacinum infernum DSM 9756 TaxID=1121391 RepID=A0A1M5FVA2_9BACT|nr:CerR family C-terminal domain-containing protein [Desulfacinum infernum]SHF95477.1 transcriptional regulator, TetR family [Desulfacinum infernum DSM 9756]